MQGSRSVFVTAAVVLASAAPAAGSPVQESLLQDDDLLLHSGTRTADATLDELRSLGVDRVRVSVIWRDLAPAQPGGAPLDASKLGPLDHAVKGARARGIEVLLNVRGGAPDWALGKAPRKLAGRDAYKPSFSAFGRFVEAIGRRYDGTHGRLPRVTAWSVWNEPNWGGHLQPQSERVGRKRKLVTVAPRWYRNLYRAAAQGLRASGHGGDIVLVGETAPLGSSKLGHLAPIKPLRFLRDLFCLNRRLRPLGGRAARRLGCDFDRNGALPATGFAHHPYAVTDPPEQASPDRDVVRLADADRLKAVLDAAADAGRISPNLPLWYTEFGWQTSPPDPYRGVPLDSQADWLMRAERLTWSDPRVAGLTQFLLRDDEPRTQFGPQDRRRWSTYQTGLRFADGAEKPAYAAYRLPAVAEDRTLWGLVRPGANGVEQRVRLEFRANEQDGWTTLSERAVTDPRGYFAEPLPADRAGFFRYSWVRREPDRQTLFGTEPGREIAVPSRAVRVG